MVSVFDVAKRTGLSIATVSRALNGKPAVSDKARRRVLQAASELGYQPNTFAQNLRLGRGSFVALASGDMRHGVYSALAKCLQLELEKIQLDTLLYDLDHQQERLHRRLDNALATGMRAIVLANSDRLDLDAVTPYLEKAIQQGVVIISTTQRLDAQGIPSIVHDNILGAKLAVQHLQGEGRKAISFLGRLKTSAVGSERYEGYVKALAEIDQPLVKSRVWASSEYFRSQAGYHATMSALKKKVRFDAVLAATDDIALGVMSALREYGVKVPDDVAVIGFGGAEWAPFIVPALSTVVLDVDAMASAVRKRLELAEDGAGNTDLLTLIKPQLVIRESA